MAAPRRPRSLGRRPVALSLLAGALTTLLAAHAHDVGRQFGRGRSLPTLIAVQPDAVLVERRWLSERTISCELYGTALPATRGEAIRRAGEVTWSDDPLLGLASLTMPSPRVTTRVVLHGWPWPVLAGSSVERGGAAPSTLGLLGVSFRGVSHEIAFIPHPLPLVASVAGWGLLWWMLLFAPSAARREWRRRRGRCPHCAYPRTGIVDSAVCPECGMGA